MPQPQLGPTPLHCLLKPAQSVPQPRCVPGTKPLVLTSLQNQILLPRSRTEGVSLGLKALPLARLPPMTQSSSPPLPRALIPTRAPLPQLISPQLTGPGPSQT